mmetsp:Transcript_9563/g.21735  ORF Transcript_9563/g.21735 Transcript_9563/m.21735 type:complete len:358 (+) Transcript_9563:36-1109(+)
MGGALLKMMARFLVVTCLAIGGVSAFSPTRLAGGKDACEAGVGGEVGVRDATSRVRDLRLSTALFAGGFGAAKKCTVTKKKKSGGKELEASSKPKTPAGGDSFSVAAARNPKEAQRVLKLYGGDVQKGTVERISKAREALAVDNPALAEAMQLTAEVLRWEATTKGLSLLQQTSIPAGQWEKAARAKTRLESIKQEHGLSAAAVHNAFQRLTWDASAEAKAFRATADLGANSGAEATTVAKIDRALSVAAQAVHRAAGGAGRLCDVGAGTGILVPLLERFRVQGKQITGVDLSPEVLCYARYSGTRRGFGSAVAPFRLLSFRHQTPPPFHSSLFFFLFSKDDSSGVARAPSRGFRHR